MYNTEICKRSRIPNNKKKRYDDEYCNLEKRAAALTYHIGLSPDLADQSTARKLDVKQMYQ